LAHINGLSAGAQIATVRGQRDHSIPECAIYAEPGEWRRLLKAKDIECLAPALGSVHRQYKGRPTIGFNEINDISETIELPPVLHGGMGIPSENIQHAITLDTAKINVNTENQIAQTKMIRDVLAKDQEVYDPRKYMGPGREAIKETVISKMKEFGSSNKA